MTIENIKPGTVIRDSFNHRYLVVNINIEKNAVKCLDDKFSEVSIGIDWIKEYDYVEDLDINEITKILKDCSNLFKDTIITVDTFLNIFPDIDSINYSKKIIVFDDEYYAHELNLIYDLLKNKWQVNHLYTLNLYQNLTLNPKYDLKYSKVNYLYDYNHALIQNKIIFVENADLNVICDAYDLYEYYINGFETYFVKSEKGSN